MIKLIRWISFLIVAPISIAAIEWLIAFAIMNISTLPKIWVVLIIIFGQGIVWGLGSFILSPFITLSRFIAPKKSIAAIALVVLSICALVYDCFFYARFAQEENFSTLGYIALYIGLVSTWIPFIGVFANIDNNDDDNDNEAEMEYRRCANDYEMDDEIELEGGKTARFIKYNHDGTQTAEVAFTDEETGDVNSETILQVDIIRKINNSQDSHPVANSETMQSETVVNQPAKDLQQVQNHEIESKFEYSNDKIKPLYKIDIDENNIKRIDVPLIENNNHDKLSTFHKVVFIAAGVIFVFLISWIIFTSQNNHKVPAVIVKNNFELTIPSGWKENPEYRTKNSEVETAQIYNENGSVVVMCLQAVLSKDAMKEQVMRMLNYLDDPILKGASYVSSLDSKFKGYESTEIIHENRYKNRNFYCKTTIISTRTKSYLIISVYPSNEDGLQMSGILKFIETPKSTYTIYQRVYSNMESLNSKLPQQVDEFTIYKSVSISGNTLNHEYEITDDFDLSDVDLQEFERLIFQEQIKQLKEMNSPLINEWLEAGYDINYSYSDSQGKQLGSFKIYHSDLTDYDK